MFTRTLLHCTTLSPSGCLSSRIQNVASKMHSEWASHQPSITDENIEVVERIVMRNRRISIRRLAEELAIPKITIHEIMNNHMGMKKVCTWWILKLLTPIQRTNSVDCCQGLLQQSEVNPDNFFHSIVIGDEFWIRHYDPLSQLKAKVWKRLGEQTPTRLHQERSARKIMMIIF